MTEDRVTVVPNFLVVAPAAPVVGVLAGASRFELTAAAVAEALGEPVRAVVARLNVLAAERVVSRWVGSSGPDAEGEFRPLAAVWALESPIGAVVDELGRAAA